MGKSKSANKWPKIFSKKPYKANHELKPILEFASVELTKFCEKVPSLDKEVKVSLHNIIESLIFILSKDRKTLRLLQRMHAHGSYLFSHGLSSAMMSLWLAVKMGLTNEKLLEIISYGGLFHDVGLLAFSVEQIESHSVFESKKDYRWKELVRHCKIGVKLIEEIGFLPEEVRFIIMQHHERVDGMGYPNQIPGEVVFFPAKIVSVADAFAAMIVDRPHRPAFTINQTIQIMSEETGKFDYEIFQTFKDLIEEEIKQPEVVSDKAA